ncbi:MAG: hypothetical protein KGI50_07090 [Patescibacteria group bacterium]|nr:hypothetical protein [Patescibacteria group bacterium]
MADLAELNDAITKGINELGELPEFSSEEVEEKETPVPVKSDKRAEPSAETGGTEETEVEEVEEEEELDEETTKNAIALFKALNNPSTSKAAFEFLAKELGVEMPSAAPATKKEVVEQTKDIIEQMKEAAPGLEFLIDKIGPVIKDHLNSVREELKGEVETDRVERANNELRTETSKAMTELAKAQGYKDNLIPSNILNEMKVTMSKIQPSPDLKPAEYLKIIHDATTARLGIQRTVQKQTPRSPAARLASERVNPTISKTVPKKMSLSESILSAVDSLSGRGD